MQLLHGRYEILEIIKSGGMGSVYEAKDTKLADSLCAVKEILEDKQNVLYFQTRFEQEMKTLAELDHPAIPRVRDFFRLRGKHYLVMDLVRGQSLFDEMVEKKGPLVPEQVASDMLELLDILDYLHSHSPPMIHRDIKPSNILRDRRSRQIKLVDFGLARAACGATQTAVGTLGYCAPEQAIGRADTRSDLYSVGATMIQLLTGQDPDMLKPEAQLQKIPPGLRPIIQRATRLKAHERYASAKEMAGDLKLYLRSLERRGMEPEPPQPQVVYVEAPGHRWRGYATAAALVLALGLGTWLGRSENPTPVAAPAAASLPVKPGEPTVVGPPPAPAIPIAAPTRVADHTAPEPEVETTPPPPPKPPAPVAEIRPSLGASSYPTYQASERIQPSPLPEPAAEEQAAPTQASGPRWRSRLGLPPRRWRR
ncbi:MAG: serine/threonine protein kinase [Candidatus Eremiobacteraeota bacterium]|nr:serine/threonine protein kinase [Candidatus Eremiobacteraeota bacterium]MCW5869007.1 serine/threonine protein kinase [Candidatus Eremiobacteraeota bacterium]